MTVENRETIDEIKKVKVDIHTDNKNYDIIIADNIIKKLPEYIKVAYSGCKLFLVTDRNVMNLYGEKISAILIEAGFNITTYIVPPGEEAKSFDHLKKGYDILLEEDFRRDNMIVALGGGVVGDLAGFLAATFMRGIPFVQVPTTLLAQVDSSVGGKTAINHPTGKNLIGSFYQPEFVLIDPNFLKTLPERELKTGLAELIKHGFIADDKLLKFLWDKHHEIFEYDMESLIHIIYRSCIIKSEIVNQDEKEAGKRALLNFGHTIGHALEAVTEYKSYNHGEAVAVGMVGAAHISYKMGLIDQEAYNFIKKLIKVYGLPLSYQYNENVEKVYQRLFYDKKVKNNSLRWILLKDLGEAYIDADVSNEIVRDVLEGLK